MLDLALHIVDTKRGDFEPGKFEDQYEDALRELIEKKAKGEKIERPKQPARSNVVSLMDALRVSVKAERQGEQKKGRRAHVAPTSKKSPRHTVSIKRRVNITSKGLLTLERREDLVTRQERIDAFLHDGSRHPITQSARRVL
jgi:hypothetical protein